MLRLLGLLYARRIVNVNVNIVLAGALALPPTLAAVWLAHRLGVQPGWRISLITFVTDICADVMIYLSLHWLANHSPSLNFLRSEEARRTPRPHLSFFRDATLIQVERAALSPLLYLLLLGTQYTLSDRGMHPVPATAIAFAVAIGTTRTLHTLWMYRQERRTRMDSARLPRKTRAVQRLTTGPAPIVSASHEASGHQSAQPVVDAAAPASGVDRV